MKKNTLILMLSCCIGILFISCGNDDAGGENNSDQIEISAVCPGKNMATDHKLRCIFEAWTKEGNAKLVYHKEVVAESVTDVFSFNFSMPPGTYECMMWADYIDTDGTTYTDTSFDDADGSSLVRYTDKYYNTLDLKNVVVKDINVFVNNEACNAFFYTGEIQKGEEALQMELNLIHALTKVSVQENNLNEFSYLKELSISYQSFFKFDVAVGTVIDKKDNVIYNESDYDPTAVNDGTLFTIYMFSDEKERRVGEINMTLTKFLGLASTDVQHVTIPDIIPLLRGQHVKVSANMMEVSERENEFEIIFDINIDDWGSSNIDITSGV